jgi:mannose-1-phosphate guanylyltransferase
MMMVRNAQEFSNQEDMSRTEIAPEPHRRCAVVLAGGDGRRLESFVRRLRGDTLPKQYVTLYGTHSLLDRTFERVERLIPPDRIMTVVSREHFRYNDACRQLARRPKGTVIVQPQNKDTAPGLLLPLAYLRNDRVLMEHVETAFRTVECHPDLIVLLGVRPDDPEHDYGYVLAGPSMTGDDRSEVRMVSRFIEKPSRRLAENLAQRGALWNTSIFVCQLQTLLDLMWCTAPVLALAFTEIAEAIDTAREHDVIDAVYQKLPPVNFSRGVLELVSERLPSHLAVLRVDDGFWSDWGVERRILRDLRTMNASVTLSA